MGEDFEELKILIKDIYELMCPIKLEEALAKLEQISSKEQKYLKVLEKIDKAYDQSGLQAKYTKEMQDNFKNKPAFIVDNILVSVSNEDLNNGSPKVGDMIARNPKNHKDLWLVAKEYFEDNFEVI